MPRSSPTTDPPSGRGAGGFARLVRWGFWGLQALALLGLLMVLAGLAVEEVAPGAAILHVLVVPIGLLPLLGPVWIVASPILAVLMLLTRGRRESSGDA